MSVSGQGSNAVTVTEHFFIPLKDGTRLAARMWLPHEAGSGKVPALLEYIPYRKRDGTRGRDEPMHGYFARSGYAVLRVDMRGSGESDGLLDDEYLALEQDDALEVIDWLAAQPWCDGNVGMMGKSWGGFNCLQVAARRPQALKAILTVCSTEDRFGGDIHYMGGGLLNDNLWWGSIMLAYQGRPADPELLGDAWRRQWIERLEHMPFWPALWLKHQRRDDYWKHGSICEDWSAIQCPVFAVGGWADSYTSAVPQLLEHLQVPRIGVIGPWAHIYPQDGVPGPAIGFLQEALRWWDHWLKGRDTGIMDEPMLRAYVEDRQDPVSPTKSYANGRWRAEPVWPSPAVAPLLFYPQGSSLASEPAAAPEARQVRSPLWTGIMSGEWMGTGVAGEMPGDQRLDDGNSLSFDTAALTEDIECLGQPIAELTLSADAPLGQLAVRVCDVAPDGSSQRVSYGVLNLAHRNGSEHPKPLVPGEAVRIVLTLKAFGHRFAAGHRIRIALSSAYWPLLWPAPHAATLTVDLAKSRFALPVRRSAEAEEPPVGFPPPDRAPPAPISVVAQGRMERTVTLDALAGEATYVTVGEGGLFGEGVQRFDEIDTTLNHSLTRRLTVKTDDPLSARSIIDQSYEMGRDGWRIRIETRAEMTGDAGNFRMTGWLKAYENGALVAERVWDEGVERDCL
jgi:putative CocE/NonD family hydrolase